MPVTRSDSQSLVDSAQGPHTTSPEGFPTSTTGRDIFQRIFDVLCAALALVLLSPLLIVIAALVKLQNDGPVFYAQPRIGRQFRVFRLYKFRTMIEGADKSGLLTSTDDSRITRLGKYLRKYKLDELPQLLNVLKGDMQLVGPRPEVERYVVLFRSEYALLLQDRPGITDPATLAHRREETLLSGEFAERQYISRLLPAKLRMSLDYRANRTFFSDLIVLIHTTIAIFA